MTKLLKISKESQRIELNGQLPTGLVCIKNKFYYLRKFRNNKYRIYETTPNYEEYLKELSNA